MPHANLSQPLFFLGVITAFVGLFLIQFSLRGQTLSGYDVTEASYVLGLFALPLILFSMVWAFRSYASAIAFGIVGALVSLAGIGLFSYYYPAYFNPFGEAMSTETVTFLTVYLLGLLLLLVGLYVGHTLRAQRLHSVARFLQAQTEVVATPAIMAPVAVPMGQVLPVNELVGVRRAEARRLAKVGIRHTGQLLVQEASAIGRMTQIDEVRIGAWQSMADLVRIDGIGPRFAAMLYRSGIVSVNQLAEQTPDNLIERVKQFRTTAKPRMRARIDRRRAKAWIREAQVLTRGLPNQTSAKPMARAPMTAAVAQ